MTEFLPNSALMTVLVLGAAGVSFSQGPAIPKGPWKELFNKRDLTGWAAVGNPPWSVVNGVLQTKGGSTKTYLIWKEPLKDFELEVKYRLSSDNTNSGIQIRSKCSNGGKLPDCGGSYVVCGPQLDVKSSYSGRLFEECVDWLLFDGQNINNCRSTFTWGDWTTTTAKVKGDSVSLWLNGRHCLDYKFTNTEHLTGTIFALQSHPPYSLIEWESVKIRDLSAVTQVTPASGKWAGSVAVAKSVLHYSVPEAGDFFMRLLDVNGAVAWETSGKGPIKDAKQTLPSPGIFFLEVISGKTHSRHTIHNF